MGGTADHRRLSVDDALAPKAAGPSTGPPAGLTQTGYLTSLCITSFEAVLSCPKLRVGGVDENTSIRSVDGS